MTRPTKVTLLASGSVLLFTLAVYANSFTASFHFDDFYSIVENDRIKNIHNLWSIITFNPSRFLVFLTLALNYSVGRLNTVGYHIVNVLFHAGTGILVYAVASRLVDLPRPRPGASVTQALQSRWPALFPALIFVGHPMQTEAVTYIIQRSTVMGTFFFLLALWFFMRAAEDGRRAPLWNAGAAAGFILSSFCREEAATLPVILLLYDYIFVSGGRLGRLRSRARIHAVMWVLLALFFIVRHSLYGTVFNPVKPFTVSTYLITESVVVLKYIQLLLFPVNQNVDHDFPPFASLLGFWPLISLAIHLSIIAWAVRRMRTEKVLSFSILWFYIGLAPTSSIVPLQDFMAEHRTYLSSVGFCIALSALFLRAAEAVGKRWNLRLTGAVRSRA